MEPLHLDHYTLAVAPAALAAVRDFYVRVLALREGPRPDFDFPGHWLYAGGTAIVHLAGTSPSGEPAPTGRLDHISMRTRGLVAARERLAELGVPWREAPVPGAPLHQIFVTDPAGLRVELTFDAAERPAGEG